MKQKIKFENSKKDKLAAILSSPETSLMQSSPLHSTNTMPPIVILCHGFSTSKDNSTNNALEKQLNDNNIAILRFDFYGHGESEGQFEDISLSEAVDDILSAISFIKEKGYSNIGLFGSSFGGAASIIAGSRSEDIKLLVLKSPVSNYEENQKKELTAEELKEWKEKGYRYYIGKNDKKFKLNYSFFEDLKNNNGYKAGKYIQVPTCIVHGDQDQIVPVEQSKIISSIIPQCTLHIMKNVGHRYTDPIAFNTMINIVSNYIINEFKK